MMKDAMMVLACFFAFLIVVLSGVSLIVLSWT